MERFPQEVDFRGKAKIDNRHLGSCTSNHFHRGCNLPESLILTALTKRTMPEHFQQHMSDHATTVSACQGQWLWPALISCALSRAAPRASAVSNGCGMRKSNQTWFIVFNSSLPTSGCMRQWRQKPTEPISCFLLLRDSPCTEVLEAMQAKGDFRSGMLLPVIVSVRKRTGMYTSPISESFLNSLLSCHSSVRTKWQG